jgi:hypothetical protein
LHTDWAKYDTAHVVFRPRHMSAEELQHGYGWMYHRLFSAQSIWARRPDDARAVAPYLLMSTLYKRSNWLWQKLIEHDLTHAAWSPLVEWTRVRHLSFRRALSERPLDTTQPVAAAHCAHGASSRPRRSLSVVSASV